MRKNAYSWRERLWDDLCTQRSISLSIFPFLTNDKLTVDKQALDYAVHQAIGMLPDLVFIISA